MKRRLLYAVASGAALIFAFAPYGLFFLAYFAFIPLFFALEGGVSRKKVFFIGWVSGVIFFTGTVYWVVNSMYYYGGVPFSIGVLVMLLLAAILAVYVGVFAVLFDFAAKRKLGLFVVPVFWVALEFLRAKLLSGFPWALLGYSQLGWLPLAQAADIFGVWGLSFFAMFVNVALYAAIKSYLGKCGASAVLRPLIAASVMIIAIVLYGYYKLSIVEKEAAAWPKEKVAITQGNIEQSLKWDTSKTLDALEAYVRLTAEAKKQGATLVVWPESAAAFYLEHNAKLAAIVFDSARKNKISVLTGAPHYDPNEFTKEYRYYNSAYMITEEGVLSGRYDKVHLVPFGEYVPLKNILFFIKKLTAGVGDFVPGDGALPLKFGEQRVGVLICYEAIFPEIAADFMINGTNVLVNITNDAWFGKTSAPYEHLDMTVMRAIENRVFLIRSANTGISAVVAPTGEILQRSGLFEEAVFTADVGMKKLGALTFFARAGRLFPFAMFVLSIVIIVYSLRRGPVRPH